MNTLIKRNNSYLLIILLAVIIMLSNRSEVFAEVEIQEPDTSWYTESVIQAKQYEIKTANELRGLRELVDTDKNAFQDWEFTLGADIDLENQEWTPIGQLCIFKGSFDGKNHTISNLVNKPATQTKAFYYGGLFARVQGYVTEDTREIVPSHIKNITIDGVDINVQASIANNNRPSSGIGSIVGYAKNVHFDNCTVKNVNIETNYWQSGGMIGLYEGGDIMNCKAEAVTINNTNTIGNRSGLLCGYMLAPNQATNPSLPFVINNISVNGEVTGIGVNNSNVGGLCGFLQDTVHQTGSEVSNVIVEKGTKISGVDYVSGAIGGTGISMTNIISYATVEGSGSYIAGIACTKSVDGTSISFENCINAGSVKGKSNVASITSGTTYGSFENVIINKCYNLASIDSEEDSVDHFAKMWDGCTVSINNSYSLGKVSYGENSGIIPSGTSLSNVCYLTDAGIEEIPESVEVIGLSEAQFKDRTAIEVLNRNLDTPAWFQNVDYPDFDDNMIPVTDITSDDTASVDIDQEIALTVSVTPEDATNPALTFKSSDEEIATVDADGKVKGIKAGEADITITALYDGSQKVCKVTVKDPAAEKEKADKEAADKVIKMIKGIDITKATEAQLKAVQEAYNALTDDQKKLVDADSEAAEAMKKIDAKVEEMEKESSSSDKKDSTTVAVKKGATFTVKGYKYKVTSNLKKDPTVTVTGYKNKKLKKIVVPASVKYKNVTFKVTAIGKSAFKGQKKAKTAVIGNNVKNIGATAFAGDAKCKKITVRTAVRELKP